MAALDNESMSPRMNVHPGPITDAAWFNDPRRDCSSLLVHRQRPCHFAMSTLRCCSSSDGSLSWKDSASITMPKNDREALNFPGRNWNT